MPEDTSDLRRIKDISVHVFYVSSAMVGVCLTFVGIFAIYTEMKKVQTLADEMVVIDGLLFLFSCILSYLAVRSKSDKKSSRYLMLADIIFLLALFGTVLISGFIVLIIL